MKNKKSTAFITVISTFLCVSILCSCAKNYDDEYSQKIINIKMETLDLDNVPTLKKTKEINNKFFSVKSPWPNLEIKTELDNRISYQDKKTGLIISFHKKIKGIFKEIRQWDNKFYGGKVYNQILDENDDYTLYKKLCNINPNIGPYLLNYTEHKKLEKMFLIKEAVYIYFTKSSEFKTPNIYGIQFGDIDTKPRVEIVLMNNNSVEQCIIFFKKNMKEGYSINQEEINYFLKHFKLND
ncbi:hypothetical protein LNTAR_04181 [Lentisphaera araneosa HTCC2155]|uniref:Lipoprotein n=1 Tax=Lentisphaera araneosa HTCC2155 TaxID=313628 RepID=A6DTY2_9BACT|nr:hypothetical protein [Lentisphaera araneosa]EDM24898.1 hypothetical protein LNTAR_04181 [Lentisphaera araneosa HTCC2155]